MTSAGAAPIKTNSSAPSPWSRRHQLRPNKPEENILKTLITFSGIKIIKNGNIKCFLELNLE